MTAVSRVHEKASLLQDQIAALRFKARDSSDPEHWAGVLCAPYFSMLEKLYSEEMPLAQAIDTSDLLIHAEGPSLSDHAPRLTLVEQFFANLRVQVFRLTKAIAGIDESMRLSKKQVELGLSGLAPGSLYVGLKVKPPVDLHGQQSVLGDADPLFMAAREAVRTIKVATQHFDDSEALRENLPDPQVRDAAMVAISRLAPSRQSGVRTVTVELHEGIPRPLTHNVRRELNRTLRNPVVSVEYLTLTGEVREMDLDAQRFELRRIENDQARVVDVRCAYDERFYSAARHWIGHRVEVHGRFERLANGSPRLVSVDDVKVLDVP